MAGLVTLAAAAALLAACSSKPQAAPRSPGPSRSASSAGTVLASPTGATAQVIDAWRHYWQVYVEVGGQTNPQYSQLQQVATGQELTTLESGFLAYHANGQILKGSIELAPDVTSVSGSQATLSDCYLSSIFRYTAATGEPVEPTPSGGSAPGRTLVDVTMTATGGTWKVSGIDHVGDACTPAS